MPLCVQQTDLSRIVVRLAAGCLLAAGLASVAFPQGITVPEGTFKELKEEGLGDALLIHDRQLFIDDYVIDELVGARQVLQQPVKHPANPLIRRDRPGEQEPNSSFAYGAVLHDPRDGLFKMWYQIWQGENPTIGVLGYAVSTDGVQWEKPAIDAQTGSNLVQFDPPQPWVAGAGVLIDERESDSGRRFKMVYLAEPTLKSASLQTCIAYSADGMHWRAEPANPVIPYSDTQVTPYWDSRLSRFVAYLRFGPPNVRIISRIESQDFLHWSNKVTVVNKSPLDGPFSTELYTMSAMPYAGAYVGVLNTYHGETIQPIPADQPWMDRVDNQLVFSRNGVTWQRVLHDGAATAAEMQSNKDWKDEAQRATFLPYGEFQKDWDWGQIYPFHPPLVVGDEIRIYYTGMPNHHWWNYHKDEPGSGIGLATLRLDGFVAIEAADAGTLTTKPLVFFGDTLVVNADASQGSISVEAQSVDGQPIPGFTAADCDPLTSDSVRHVVSWKGNADCAPLQGSPIRLVFHVKQSKLFAFEPQVRRNHYLQSYE
ncbi:MAG: hypothetical protein JNG89_01885 [Planctomycetaceae bacterium]|nr:hypothetical protein [Planctomycetaceae bacterium]